MPNRLSFSLLLCLFAAHFLSPKASASPLNAEDSLAKLKSPDYVRVSLFAAEPQLTNPTNIDVDDRGRVWVCDVMNYRGNQGSRPEGDRILILEDSDGDGRADTSKTFYQGTDVDSALGICVLPGEPLRVVVSCSPNVWLMTDDDGDDLADRKEALLSNTGIPQHDHSAHAFVFGPDGRFYWNIGNSHQGVHDAEGRMLVDRRGRALRPDGKPFREGMAFRSNLDGSELDLLGHNQRNSYELTVDSFGNVWFSDNDDDGNQGTRIGVVFEGGNYGYRDELTGRSWRDSQRINTSSDIRRRHWHANDPGSIPNIASVGNGSPSGIVAYEGEMIAELRRCLIHCEPGLNLVRNVALRPDGAGYQAEITPLVDGAGDSWFRPVDAAVAPDGSIMIADWYDPGVGGHRQADLGRGRIYRIAAASAKGYTAPDRDYSTARGAAESLRSGSMAVRNLAWNSLSAMGAKARGALEHLAGDDDPIVRSRAYWLLSKLPNTGLASIRGAAADSDPEVRAAAIRMARSRGEALPTLLTQLAGDPSPMVRRACAIALCDLGVDQASSIWHSLARQLDPADRWMIEALGLAADGRWDRFLDPRRARELTQSESGRALLWRSRGSTTLPPLIEIVADPQTPADDLPGYLRAIDFHQSPQKEILLGELVERAQALPLDRRRLVTLEAIRRTAARPLPSEWRQSLEQVLHDATRDDGFARAVREFQLDAMYDDVLSAALEGSLSATSAAQTISDLLDRGAQQVLANALAEPGNAQTLLVRMLADASHVDAGALLWPIIMDPRIEASVRREALRGVVATRDGATRAVVAAENNELDQPMTIALAYALRMSLWKPLCERAERLCPDLPSDAAADLPIAQWMKMQGHAGRGEQLFFAKANCNTCHKVGDRGKEVGPPLSEIGAKLSRHGLYEAMLFPSAAINHSYETYSALTDAGVALKGILVGSTEKTVTLKTEQGILQELPRDELAIFEKQAVSLMPSGLEKILSPQEIADVAAYLATLRPEDGG